MAIAEGSEATVSTLEQRRDDKAKPVSPTWRVFKAHIVAFVVLGSYLWVRFLARYGTRATNRKRMERAHRRNARRIYRTIIRLQGLYIKVGQLFSIMANFLPEAFREELAGLQDSVPPHPYADIEARIRAEFGGQAPSTLFQHFDPNPIASASIGQVHTAHLHDGSKVAVKVQYPNIESVVRADLATLRSIFNIVQRFIRYQGLDSIYNEISALVLEELDFRAEAQKCEQIAKTFQPDGDVKFPAVVHELTTRRVITTEYIEGVKIGDLKGLTKLGIDRSRLAKLVIEAYCQQIFHRGFYHADPHPGNILVAPGPCITFIDFGAVGQLSESMRHGLVQLLQAAINRDTQKIITALHEMGFIAHRADPMIYDRVIEYLHARFQREVKLDSFNLKDIRFDPQKGLENLADLRQMDISLGDITDTFHVPKEWIVLERTILMLTGLCTELDPDLNPMTVIRPHVEHFVLGEDGDWSRFMLDTGREIALSLIGLPAELKKFTSRAVQGQIQVRVVGPPDSAAVYYALGHQLIYTVLGMGSGAGALHFYGLGMHDWMNGLLVAAGTCGLLLLRSMWVTRKLMKRRRDV